MKKKCVLLLYIYILFSFRGIGQNLQLSIQSENTQETQLIDSLDYVKNHKDFASLKTEIVSFQLKLNQIGYLQNELLSIIKSSDTLYTAYFNLKNQYKSIAIFYDKNDVSKDLINDISDEVFEDYFIIPFNNIEETLNYINLKIAEQGNPFSTLQLADIHISNNNSLTCSLVITRNDQKRSIDEIVIKGYNNFPKSYLKHYLKIRQDDVFNLDIVKAKTDLLKNLNFAAQIKSPEVLFTNDSTALYLYIEKSQSNTFDGFLGFGTNEANSKIGFDGYLNLNLINNLNYGESFNLIYKSDENEQKTFRANLNLPFILGTPLGSEVKLNIFKKDSSFTTVNQRADIYYQLNSKSKLYIGIDATESNNLLSENVNTAIKDYNTTFYNVRYQYINRQTQRNLFTTNFLLELETGFGKRQIAGQSTNQTQANLIVSKIFNLNSKNSFFVRGDAFGLFSGDFLENELRRFGGINSIRGFEENSIPASIYGLVKVEYRYLVSNSIYLHTITDVAYFENEIIDQREKLYGFGFGFGILTKSGLLKLNYANGKNEKDKFKMANSKIHLSLSTRF